MESDNEWAVRRLLTTRDVSTLTWLARWRLFELERQGKGPLAMRLSRTLR